MANGIPILGTVTKKCKVSQVNTTTFKIILVQGLNRQIRRMCEYLGYEVQKLKRTRIMNVSLGTLKTGDWRELTAPEMKALNGLLVTSSKTEEASINNVIAPKNKSKKPNFSSRSKFGRTRRKKNR